MLKKSKVIGIDDFDKRLFLRVVGNGSVILFYCNSGNQFPCASEW